MAVTYIFTCGHQEQGNGLEDITPRCKVDGAPLRRVVAPKPRFKGAK